eukprot:2408852-Rhodomonas_salina.5
MEEENCSPRSACLDLSRVNRARKQGNSTLTRFYCVGHRILLSIMLCSCPAPTLAGPCGKRFASSLVLSA